ncbi:MAG: hypothetical protein JXJ04_10860 [Spirochaetales bacterium]|nr:hypothetical protein [Spirochaetales bacterium]
MSSTSINEKILLKEIRSLDDDKKKEVIDFIHFLKDRKASHKKIDWEDITGIVEFEEDASTNHDLYLNKTI